MSRTPLTHIIAAVIGGFVTGCIVLGVLALATGATGFASCTAMTGFGWVVPLVAGLIIGGVALLLLDSKEAHDEPPAEELRASTCASCGNQIIAEWRMCPHCGSLLECEVRSPSGHTLQS